MVNNYPEYAAGVNYKKTDSNNVTHFYSAQVVADPSDDSITSKLIKDGVVIAELPDGGGGGNSDFSNWIKCEVTQAMSGESEALKLDRKYNDIDNSNIYYIIPSESDAAYITAPDIANKIIALLFVDYDEEYGVYVGGYDIAKIDPTAGSATISMKIATQTASVDDDLLFVANT